MLWFRKRAQQASVETRQASSGAYTDRIVESILAASAGDSKADVRATAVLEACAGAYSRAFSIATVEGADVPPDILGAVGRDLIRHGEALYVIDVQGSMIRFLPAAAWDVRGGADPRSWHYRADVFGPSRNDTMLRPASSVLHFRYSFDRAAPWRGVGPLSWASMSGKLHAAVESAMRDEASGPRGFVLPMPVGPDSDGDDDESADPMKKLQKDISGLKGGVSLVESVAAGWGDKGLAPGKDWVPQRIGMNAPQSMASIRNAMTVAIASACGVPPTLITEGADATSARESWRRFLHGSLAPVAESVAAELSDKLNRTVTLNFDRLFASDIQARARALHAMAQAGMPLDAAMQAAGIDE